MKVRSRPPRLKSISENRFFGSRIRTVSAMAYGALIWIKG